MRNQFMIDLDKAMQDQNLQAIVELLSTKMPFMSAKAWADDFLSGNKESKLSKLMGVNENEK